jgi:hypothetical protein
MGKKFKLRIDHIGLKYLFEHPTLNVDALSRRVNTMHHIVFSMHQSDLKRIILYGLVTDQHYLQVKENLQ